MAHWSSWLWCTPLDQARQSRFSGSGGLCRTTSLTLGQWMSNDICESVTTSVGFAEMLQVVPHEAVAEASNDRKPIGKVKSPDVAMSKRSGDGVKVASFKILLLQRSCVSICHCSIWSTCSIGSIGSIWSILLIYPVYLVYLIYLSDLSGLSGLSALPIYPSTDSI